MDVQTRIRQLTWRSKRGLLELELLLLPFVQSCLAELSSAELEQYGKLLELDDLDLYDWLRGHDADGDQSDAMGTVDSIGAIGAIGARDESLLPIVERIRRLHLA